MVGEAIGLIFTVMFAFVVILVVSTVLVKTVQAKREQQSMELHKQSAAEQQQFAQSQPQMQQVKQTTQASKHQKHVEDASEHAHLGEEEHYEEIIGSLGEVNDEGCTDLNGVRFLVNDLAYELHSDKEVDYDRIAQAMVLGEIINTPRFKAPYSRRK